MNLVLLPSQKCRRIIQERNFKFSTFIHNSSISYVMLPSISNRFANRKRVNCYEIFCINRYQQVSVIGTFITDEGNN